MVRYVVDTNLYVEAIRTDEGNRSLAEFQRRYAPVLFQHSVVAQEILAGAKSERAFRAYHEDWVEPFEELGRVLAPGHGSWMGAALIMTRLVERGWKSPGGFTRSFLNDCLIAATAREHGFVLITRNTHDYTMIGEVEPGLRFEAPWPEQV